MNPGRACATGTRDSELSSFLSADFPLPSRFLSYHGGSEFTRDGHDTSLFDCEPSGAGSVQRSGVARWSHVSLSIPAQDPTLPPAGRLRTRAADSTPALRLVRPRMRVKLRMPGCLTPLKRWMQGLLSMPALAPTRVRKRMLAWRPMLVRAAMLAEPSMPALSSTEETASRQRSPASPTVTTRRSAVAGRLS